MIGTSLISTSATTKSSLAFVGTGGFPTPTACVRSQEIKCVTPNQVASLSLNWSKKTNIW